MCLALFQYVPAVTMPMVIIRTVINTMCFTSSKIDHMLWELARNITYHVLNDVGNIYNIVAKCTSHKNNIF